MTKVIGLTGGIATGKSTADQFFRKNNIPVIDADEITHQLYLPGQKANQLLLKKYGRKILNKDQTINRQVLSSLVFHDQKKLTELTNLVVPLVYDEIDRKIRSYQKQDLVVLDAPTLFETSGENRCDYIIVVSLPKEIQIKRLMKRNQLSYEAALTRISAQMPLEKKAKMASFVVENTGTIDMLEAKLAKILKDIKQEE